MMDHKPATLKLKRILPKKSKVNISPLQKHDKDFTQHKTKTMNTSRFHSLASPASPNTFETNPTLYRRQPLSPSNSSFYNRTTRTSSISCNTKIPSSIIVPPLPRGKRSHSLHHTSHPGSILLQQLNVPTPVPSTPTMTFENTARTTDTTTSSNKKILPITKNKKKRHSISSPAHHPQPQRSRTLLPEEEIIKPSTPSAAAVVVAAAMTPTSSRFTSKPSFSPMPQKSRSTPLRPKSKIKTYNVSSVPNSKIERGVEKKKRQQELEDLISGRRGSTLKLSMTPKHTLMT